MNKFNGWYLLSSFFWGMSATIIIFMFVMGEKYTGILVGAFMITFSIGLFIFIEIAAKKDLKELERRVKELEKESK